MKKGPFTRPTAPAEPKVAYFTRNGVSRGMSERKYGPPVVVIAQLITVLAIIGAVLFCCKLVGDYWIAYEAIQKGCP